MIRTACALALVAIVLPLAMCFWPDPRVVIACMFLGQGALALGIAVFVASEHRRMSSGDGGDRRERELGRAGEACE